MGVDVTVGMDVVVGVGIVIGVGTEVDVTVGGMMAELAEVDDVTMY